MPPVRGDGVPLSGGRAGLPPVRFSADAVLPDKVPYASPAVRLFARELGVPLEEVKGSGPKGRITEADVQAFTKAVMSGAASTSHVNCSAAAAGSAA